MLDKKDYIASVQAAVSLFHNCRALWHETVFVHEILNGQTAWHGNVEVFDLFGHPRAKRAYAWSHLDGEDGKHTGFVARLAIPPVNSPEAAVRFQIVKDAQKAK